MIINKINKILEKNFFELKKYEEIEVLDLVFYEKDGINVFLGKQNYFPSRYEDIENLALRLRKSLECLNINVYNSYLLYCINPDQINEEERILLERSSKYLRKYILSSIEDVERIFFLNQVTDNYESDINKIIEAPEEIKKIISYMDCQEGMIELDCKAINIVTQKIIESLGGNNEN